MYLIIRLKKKKNFHVINSFVVQTDLKDDIFIKEILKIDSSLEIPNETK